jgi:hypothetical protein
MLLGRGLRSRGRAGQSTCMAYRSARHGPFGEAVRSPQVEGNVVNRQKTWTRQKSPCSANMTGNETCGGPK